MISISKQKTVSALLFVSFVFGCVQSYAAQKRYKFDGIVLPILADERRWYEEEYLPVIEGRILFIGVGPNTEGYHHYLKDYSQYETIEPIVERASYGSPTKHHIGCFENFDAEYQYDHITNFGILGFEELTSSGVRNTMFSDEAVMKAFWNGHRLLKVGGEINLGLYKNRVEGQNRDYWLEKLSHPPFDKYEVLYMAESGPILVYWARKLAD